MQHYISYSFKNLKKVSKLGRILDAKSKELHMPTSTRIEVIDEHEEKKRDGQQL